MTNTEMANHIAKGGAVGIATFSTSAGEIDLAIVCLIFVAVSTTRASAVVFYDDDSAITVRSIFLNIIHMFALTVMSYGIVQVAHALGWQMSLGTILLTGGTFGWTGPRINAIVADIWIKATRAILQQQERGK